MHRSDGLCVAFKTEPFNTNVLRLARKHSLTVCDALNLDRAQRKSVAFATLDAALLRAAQAQGVAA